MLINNNLPHYTGKIHPNCDYTHGQIFPAKGVKCYQIARASQNKNEDDFTGFTYKHAPDIAYWNGKFYVQYLCNPKDEHTSTGIDVLASSTDGVHWNEFQVAFPAYNIKKCTVTDYKGIVHRFDGTQFACVHRRMCFYKSNNGKMLLLSFYGLSPKPWELCFDNNGIGRVVRELNSDGTLGKIYFIRVNRQAGFSDEQLNYPLYNTSADEEFVLACDELLQNKLYVQQWAEENGDMDELITIKHQPNGTRNEAFCWYHIGENTIIGMWKHSFCARSDDNGATWSPVEKCHTLVMSGQKVWGCKTQDGKYAMVYDPTLETQHRYPLCITTSSDGLAFDNMRLVHGEVPPMKYEGFWKDLGPQYMRGISEGNDTPQDGNLYITYSVNKEDIWIAKIPVPVALCEEYDIDECFDNTNTIDNWNLYCPKWAQISTKDIGEKQVLAITDSEPYDYAKAERIMRPSSHKTISFAITPRQNDADSLHIEVCDAQAKVAARLIFRADGLIYARTVAEMPIIHYVPNNEYLISIDIDCERFVYTIAIDGEILKDESNNPIEWKFMMAVNEVSRFILRTGERRTLSLDYVPDNKPAKPLAHCQYPSKAVQFDLYSFKAN